MNYVNNRVFCWPSSTPVHVKEVEDTWSILERVIIIVCQGTLDPVPQGFHVTDVYLWGVYKQLTYSYSRTFLWLINKNLSTVQNLIQLWEKIINNYLYHWTTKDHILRSMTIYTTSVEHTDSHKSEFSNQF